MDVLGGLALVISDSRSGRVPKSLICAGGSCRSVSSLLLLLPAGAPPLVRN